MTVFAWVSLQLSEYLKQPRRTNREPLLKTTSGLLPSVTENFLRNRLQYKKKYIYIYIYIYLRTIRIHQAITSSNTMSYLLDRVMLAQSFSTVCQRDVSKKDGAAKRFPVCRSGFFR